MKKIYVFILFILLSSPAFSQWAKLNTLPMGKATGCFTWVIGKRVFMSGGTASKNLWEYDPIKDTWTDMGATGGNMFHTLGMAFVINGKGYIIGGDTGAAASTSAAVWEFNPSGNQWAYKGKFPGGPRKNGTAFALNSKGYIAGGTDGVNAKNDFYSYDPVNNQWQSLGTMPMGMLLNTSAFVLNNKAYVCGGDEYIPSQGNFEGRNGVWEFDGSTWKAKKNMPIDVIYGIGLATKTNGYVLGGTANFTTATKTLWKYDAANDSWANTSIYSTDNTWYLTGFCIDTTLYAGAGAGFDLATSSAIPSNDFYRYGAAPTTLSDVKAFNNFIKIYPNPCHDHFQVSAGMAFSNTAISITDIQGRVLTEAILNQEGNSILYVGNFTNGVYMLHIIKDGQKHTEKLLVHH